MVYCLKLYTKAYKIQQEYQAALLHLWQITRHTNHVYTDSFKQFAEAMVQNHVFSENWNQITLTPPSLLTVVQESLLLYDQLERNKGK